jgi:hypothetical protein
VVGAKDHLVDVVDQLTTTENVHETTTEDSSAPLVSPTNAWCNNNDEAMTEIAGDETENQQEQKTNHHLDSSIAVDFCIATVVEDGRPEDEVFNTQDVEDTAETQDERMTQDTSNNSAVIDSLKSADRDGECCTSLLSALVEEADLALEELLRDDSHVAPVIALHAKTGITGPSKPKTHRTVPTKPQSSSVTRTPKSRVTVRPKQQPVTVSCQSNKKQSSSSNGGGFKARPLPKYLSRGPPKLNLKEFKPTVQVPFRLRTEERFLGRPANCACCIAKRNARLLSASSPPPHKQSGPSPTDVTADLAPEKAAAPTHAPEPTCSPVRPLKLEDRFHET